MIKLTLQVTAAVMLTAMMIWCIETLGALIQGSRLASSGSNPTDLGNEPTAKDNVTALAFSDLRQYPNSLDRPLFFASRKIPVIERASQNKDKSRTATPKERVKARQPARKTAPLRNIKVIGIAIDNAGERRALVQTRSDLQRWLKEKQKIDGWTIERVGKNTVQLSSGWSSTTIYLYDQRTSN